MANTYKFGRRVLNVISDGSSAFDITTVQSPHLVLNTVTGIFTVGETVNQATSSAAGVVSAWDATKHLLSLSSSTGTFDATHTITGASSSATGIPNEVTLLFPNGIRMSKIDFRSSAANDILVVRERSATGAIIFNAKDIPGGGIHRSVGGRSLRVKPYMVYGEQTFGTPASVVVNFEYD